jgi:hypothetical protein
MDKLLQKFKNHIVAIVLRLEDSDLFEDRQKLPRNQQAFLKAVLEKKLDDSEWPTVLFELTQLLHVLLNREVIVLVDEYVTPTSYAIQHDYFPEVCLTVKRMQCRP